MRKFEKLSRKYKYQVRQKYQQDPFAFLVLWSLFFSAVFFIFAFRGLIAAVFMHKIDVSNESIQNEITNEAVNETNNTVNITPNNSVSSSVDNSVDTTIDQTNNSTNTTANTSAQ